MVKKAVGLLHMESTLALKDIIAAIPLSTFDSASLSGTYQLLSASGGFPQGCMLIKITNASAVPITISYDGTTDNEYIRAGESFPIYAQPLNQPQNKRCMWPLGTRVYVKGTASTGLIAVSGYYSPRETQF